MGRFHTKTSQSEHFEPSYIGRYLRKFYREACVENWREKAFLATIRMSAMTREELRIQLARLTGESYTD